MSNEFQPIVNTPRFARLFSEDRVYRIYHRHPIVLIRGLVWPLVFGFPLILLLLAIGGASGLTPVLVLLGLLLIAAWVFYVFNDWRSDFLAVTDRRVLVSVERPGLHSERREAPLGKVQNVITQRGGIIARLLKVSSVTLDTAGLGRIVFEDISEDEGREASRLVMWLQQGARAVSLPAKEQYRQEMIRSMLYGTPPPAKPKRIQIEPSPREGYGIFNTLFPIWPQREGYRVVWHKHWWFLLKAERWPLGIFFAFEFTNAVLTLALGALQVGANPLLAAFAIIRPILYIGVLAAAWWQWEDWRNDEYVLTKDRLVDKETLPFKLNESVKETELRRVTDATITVDGVIANLLRFGNVVIKTPGEATEFTFDGVPSPFEVQREVMLRLEAERENEQASWDNDIQNWLKTYIDERRAEPTPQVPQPRDDWNLGW